MKKSIWGYHVKHTDELVSSLQNQNDAMAAKISTLTTKLANVTMELNTANSEVEKLRNHAKMARTGDHTTEQLNVRIEQLEREKAAYKADADQKLAAVLRENEKLSARIKELSAGVANTEGTPIDMNSSPMMVGAICERAYSDMEKMRHSTATEMENQLDTYSYIMEDYAGRMRNSISGIKGQHGAVVNDISKSMTKIFDHLKAIETATQKLENDISPMKNASAEMSLKLKAVIEASKIGGHTEKQIPAETSPAPAKVPDFYNDYYMHPSGSSIQQDKQNPPETRVKEQEPPYGVSTSVNIDDILGHKS